MRTLILAIAVAAIATIMLGVVRSDSVSVQAQAPEVFSDIVNFALEDLVIPVGTTVRWTNRGSATHTSTSGVSPNPDGIWNTGFLATGDTAAPIPFTQLGVFD